MPQQEPAADGKPRATDSDAPISASVEHGRASGRAFEFPIVGIGASAGGLEAFTQLLEALRANTGMAFVLVQHLAADHPSNLAAILARATAMPVTEVKDETLVRLNHVYVIPPGQDMIISGGSLRLLPRERERQHRPIDLFFRSLAEDKKHLTIGVVLSGSGTDGTLGLEAIKAEGGITFAQNASAQHDSMPMSALGSGCVDFVLSPVEIGREITRIASSWAVESLGGLEQAEREPNLGQIVQRLHRATGVDFNRYKATTLFRRIARRMVVHKVESLTDYASFLEQNPGELEALYRDILINVTSFFREPDGYEALKTQVFPELAKNKTRQKPVRIWSIGCSTGEEAYSLAMAFAEFAESTGVRTPIQIFATDLNEVSIDKARAGIYANYIAQDVSAERLRLFFTEVNGKYRISKSIRDICVFSKHNILADPPFSRIDLVSCRNLLIYLEPALQQHVMRILHYTTSPGGFLWLGASETIGPYRELFEIKDSKYKIYVKRAGSGIAEVRFRLQRQSAVEADFGLNELPLRENERTRLNREGERILLARYSPPSVLVSSDLEVLQFRGDTSPYLAPAPGKATLNFLRMLREGLLPGLRAAITKARSERVTVRQQGLQLKTNEGFRPVTVEVVPINSILANQGGFLILFEKEAVTDSATALPAQEVSGGSRPQEPPQSPVVEQQIERLTQELAATHDYLQSVIEQQEAANEELQSANEEVQSANEELQSVNEELETSKEELESSNEELATINDELNKRNEELSQLNSDLNNVFDSVEMPVILVGRDLRIRRFTTDAGEMFNINAADVGRPIGHFKLGVIVPDLESLLMEAIDRVTALEREVQDGLGHWFSLRIRPYRALENKIEGAVLTLVDIDTVKRARQLAENIVATLREPLLVLDGSLRVQAASRPFCERFQVRPEETEKRLLYELGNGEWDIPDLRQRLRQILERDESFSDYTVTHHFERLGRRTMLLNARRLLQDKSQKHLILLAIEDVTTHQDLHGLPATPAEQFGRAEELARAGRSKDEFLAMLAHELRNPLAALANAVEVLTIPEIDKASLDDAGNVAQRQVRHLTRIIDDLLDISRITEDKIELQKSRTELVSILRGAVELSQSNLQLRGQTLDFPIPPEPIYLEADVTRLEQVFGNLLNNASKFSGPGAVIWLQVEVPMTNDKPKNVVVHVRDAGIGIEPEILPHVFDLFVQGSRGLDRSHGGLGVGLTLVRRLVALHGGTVDAQSEGPGRGSEFIVRLPVLTGPVPVPTASQSPKSAPPRSAPPSRRRVLVVDDHEDSLTMMALLLRNSGYNVETARNGAEALELATGFCPEVVILDIGLAGMDGYQVARRFRKIPAVADAVLIALTGYGAERDRRRAKEAGFDHHVIKPIAAEAVLELLSRALQPSS